MDAHGSPRPLEARFWSPGTQLLFAFMLLGLLFIIARLVGGLGAVTNLDNYYPWGLWIGFDVATGVALAAGGFTTAALVQILGRRRYEGGDSSGAAHRHAGVHVRGRGFVFRHRSVLGGLASHILLAAQFGALRGSHVRHGVHHGASPRVPAGDFRTRRGRSSLFCTRSVIFWKRSCLPSSSWAWSFPACTSPDLARSC